MIINKITHNSKGNTRIIWRFIIFILIIALLKASIDSILGSFLNASLLRGNLSRFGYLISVLFSLFIQIKYLDKTSFGKYGMKIEKKWVNEFFIGCLIALVQLSLFFVVMYMTSNLQIVDYFTTNAPTHSFLDGVGSEIIRQLTVSISEEIIFRSFLIYIIYEAINRFKSTKKRNLILTCIITSTLFGFAHLANEGATIYSSINLSLDGMMICLPFIITSRLGMSIGMHFSWNLLQVAIFGFPNSGQIAKASVINTTLSDNMFTGGAFGPEGSILLFALDFIAILIIIYWKKIMAIKHWINPSFFKY